MANLYRSMALGLLGTAVLTLGSVLPAHAYYIDKTRVPAHCQKVAPAHLLECYLMARKKIADSMVFLFPGSTSMERSWRNWPSSVQTELRLEFDMAMKWHTPSIRPGGGPQVKVPMLRFADPLPRGVQQTNESSAHLSGDLARRLYLSYVANSLAAEMSGAWAWSINAYNAEQLRELFHYFAMLQYHQYANRQAIYSGWYTQGAVSPANATYAVHFMRANGLVAADALHTTANLVQWSYRLRHYFTDVAGEWPDPTNFWGPGAFPAPYSYIVEGTEYSGNQPGFEGKRHWTPACWGTTQFLVWTLRAMNLPTREVPAGKASACQHRTPHFLAIGRYLSHGDDPYVSTMRNDPPVPGFELLIDAPTFHRWFPPLESDPDGAICAANTGRRPMELAIEYLTDDLMGHYCDDVEEQKSHADGEVYETLQSFYSLAELEALHLWENMALKAHVTGMNCAPH